MARKADNKEVGRRRSKQNHIAGMFELCEQMLPTRLYTSQKIRTASESEVLCRLCGKFPECPSRLDLAVLLWRRINIFRDIMRP